MSTIPSNAPRPQAGTDLSRRPAAAPARSADDRSAAASSSHWRDASPGVVAAWACWRVLA